MVPMRVDGQSARVLGLSVDVERAAVAFHEEMVKLQVGIVAQDERRLAIDVEVAVGEVGLAADVEGFVAYAYAPRCVLR